MKTINDLNEFELETMANNAFQYLIEHKEHVFKLIKSSEYAIAPSGSDMLRPELWKGIHWNWFKELTTNL